MPNPGFPHPPYIHTQALLESFGTDSPNATQTAMFLRWQFGFTDTAPYFAGNRSYVAGVFHTYPRTASTPFIEFHFVADLPGPAHDLVAETIFPADRDTPIRIYLLDSLGMGTDQDVHGNVNDERWFDEVMWHEFAHVVTGLLIEEYGSTIIDQLCALFDAPTSAWDDEGLAWRERVTESVAETFKDIMLKRQFRLFSNRTSRFLPARNKNAFLDLMVTQAHLIDFFHPNVTEDDYRDMFNEPTLFTDNYRIPADGFASAPVNFIWTYGSVEMPVPGTTFPIYGDWNDPVDPVSGSFVITVFWETAAGVIITEDAIEIPDPIDWEHTLTVPAYDPTQGLRIRIGASGSLDSDIDLTHTTVGFGFDRLWYVPVHWQPIGTFDYPPWPYTGSLRVGDMQVGRAVIPHRVRGQRLVQN